MDDHARAMGCVEQETWEWEMKDLTPESLEQMLINMRTAVDDKGERIDIRPTHYYTKENMKEINEAFDREYEIHSKDPVYRIIRACGMSTANSDINVFALEKIIADIKAEEREACAQLCESIAKPEENIYYTAPLIDIAIAAIRARGTE